MVTPLRRIFLVGAVLVLGTFGVFFCQTRDGATAQIRLAITPFPDVSQLVVGIEDGTFEKSGVTVAPVDTTWEAQYDLLTGGGVDVAISSFSELAVKDAGLKEIDRSVVYFFPAWQFQGLVFVSRPDMTSLAELRATSGAEDEALKQFLANIQNKKIVYPEGSTYESGFLRLVKRAGFSRDQFGIVNSELEAGLNALNDEAVGMVAVGAGQTIEALRRGYKVALDATDLGVTVITGFVTTKAFYRDNKESLKQFVCGWYVTLRRIKANPEGAYKLASKYMEARGASALSHKEYFLALKLSGAPLRADDTKTRFLNADARTYWKDSWDAAVENMRQTGKETSAPDDASSIVVDEFWRHLESCK